jgi:diaminohydroxyphosphoribosylaminopyrimidine deaminase/5-amino-6-(5-phosphoribosylamino)uracil reductase
MNIHNQDADYLEMCYALAEKARGHTSPNPYVGAVIVRAGRIVGWGYHKKAGNPHAEVIALGRAGRQARGATAYITLEPCTHWGRTPPCIDLVQQSGLKRVVISDYDPNPQVHRKGVRRLRAAGIQVSVGLLKEKNRKLNEVYFKYVTQKIPFVTLKAAVSLDGKIATSTSASRWISSPATREYIHLVRGEYDAVLVGINTILRDDPRLTVRHLQWRGKKQVRVVLDSGLRIPQKARILETLPRGDILIFSGPQVSARKRIALEKKGARIATVTLSKGRLNLREILAWLARHEISSVLVEGGGKVHTDFLEKGMADKFLVTVSPKLIGGTRAPSFFQGKGIQRMEDAKDLKRIREFRIRDDILIEGYF